MVKELVNGARVLASTQIYVSIYMCISDKSHSWLANSSPLEVTRMQFIINLTVCKLKLLGGQLSVSGLFNHCHLNRHEILHKNVGLTFVLVQS